MTTYTELECRKQINVLLMKMTKAKGKRKEAIRELITDAENSLAREFHDGARPIGLYSWQK